ncbi:MAG: amino acid adenylation domain-containing protein [bacterium]
MTQPDPLAARRAELERRLASLSPEKRAQFEDSGLQGAKSAAQQSGAADSSVMGRRTADTPVPMSFAQELFWRMEVANPGHEYNVPRTVRLKGPLDTSALQRALDALVVRHESLRTTFVEVAGMPRQIVQPARPVTIATEDLRSLEPSERDAAARERLRALMRRPFDLAHDSQLRVTVLELEYQDHVLLLESHHVVSDGVSRGILLRDLAALYREFTGGEAARLPELAVQYADFAIWQRNNLAGERLATLAGYWRDKLRNAPPLDLPTDRPRSAAPSFGGATRELIIPAIVVSGLKSLSGAHDTTLFMTVLAAFNALLARYSGQDDIVVGSPIAGRIYPEVDGVIGCFLNTLVLRTSLEDDPSFAELLSRVREVVLGAFEHQEVPYEKLVLDLRESGRTSTDPLFNVSFAFHDPEGRPLALAGTTSVPFGADRGATKTDLALGVAETAAGLRAAIVYRTQLFDAVTIDRMLGHLSTLLAGAVEQPNVPMSRLPLLAADERETVQTAGNGTAVDYARDKDIAQLIREQTARMPNAAAVTFEETTLSYAELDARAEQLAAHLQARGVAPNVVVALYVERSIDMVIALLAIHRAGGTYLPLDPSYPHDRLEFMLADSGAQVVVTEESLRDVLQLSGVRVVSLDGDRTAIGAAPVVAAPVMVDPERLAYLIYTSGSTGKPKGVGVTHRNVVNFLAGFGAEVPLGSGASLVAVTPLSFDISVLEMFHPLTSGAHLVVASRDTALNPGALAALLVDSKATHLQATPATWRMLIEAGWQGHPGLIALCGGEAMQGSLAAALLARGLVLWNLYGPTEATIWATMHRVSAADVSDGAATMPIGRPMANVQVYVLDAAGQLVPSSIPGELFIAGDGIAQGYHARPELSAERFVADPFSAHADARMYRTGDRARWRNDGVLEFLGRLDQQVKLRGHRIELGEIEHALASLPGVGTAAAMVREDRPGDARLIAYVVPADGETDANASTRAAEWRGALSAQLPNYMVPSAFVRLSRFPLTPNGKLDRKALPVPPDDGPSEDLYVAPRSALEERLVAIWQDVLTRSRIGVHDEFFSSGGHSLLALRIIARIADSERVRLPLRAIFEAPTVGMLAARVEAAAATQADAAFAPIPRIAGDAAPMSPAQELLWLLQRTSPDVVAYNMTEQWQVTGTIDVPALQRALDALVVRHEVFRTTFAEEGGVPTQRIGPPRSVPFELLSIAESPDADMEAARIVRDRARRPFDLSSDLLLRGTLVRRSSSSHFLMLASHHIAYDGWSRGVMLRELSALYDAERHGTSAPLSALPVRYADYASWQRDRLQGAEREKQLAYWRDRLGESSLTVDLPTDRPRGARATFSGGRRTVVFPQELLNGLRAVARANDSTIFMVLLAAYQSLLHRYSGQDDVVVGTVIAGRPRRELEGLVGYFVNTLALNATFTDDPTFLELLARVREGHLAASEHADVPFEEVVQTMHRAAGSAPVCQAMFVLQNNAGSPLHLGDATLKGTSVDTGSAKFDLYLSMGEQSNGLRATVQYRSDLFDGATIERMLDHLRTLLEGISAVPSARVSELPLLSTTERSLLLQRWSGVVTEYPRNALIHEIFERGVAAHGERVAIVSDSGSLTYAELDARANAIAAQLTACGVTAGSLVALCAERSFAMVAGILGILKAGGAYVPLDPAYPASRLAYMLGDAATPVVLAQRELADVADTAVRATATVVPRVLYMDSDGIVQDAPAPDATRAVRTSGSDSNESATRVAYVMYTSGSTGTPKGVLVPHRAVVRLVCNTDYARLTADETLLSFAPGAFDASTLEIWGALLNGGRIALAPPGLADLASLGEVVERHGVTTLWLTAALFQQVVDSGLDQYRGVRQLLAGGDVLSVPHVRRAIAALPGCRMINGYGPTENTTFTTTFTVPPSWPADAPLPIGKPIANTRAYVLDVRREPVPVGVAGELYAGGDGVALGYLNQPALTNERFVPDGFAGVEDARMYRTGDRVRWRADGAIEFLGRTDHQVKIRGFRVEPGEVEAMLASHPALREAVVVVQPAPSGGLQLVGYFVARDTAGQAAEIRTAPITPLALRAYLRERLPDYMVPAALVPMSALPVGTTGKVDRRALPAPQLDALEAEHPYVAPRTDTETRLAAIWADVLGVERISVDRNFFDLGGHSLTAMRIMSRVQEAFSVRLPLTVVFERPTVAQVAEVIEARVSEAAATATAPSGAIQRTARTAQKRTATRAPGEGHSP